MGTAKNFERRVIMALMVRMLLAQRAAIETLETQIITLKNGGMIKSDNYVQGESGFKLDAAGNFEAEQAQSEGISRHYQAFWKTFV